MTPREFRKLYAIPYDIERRKLRIERLEAMQAEGPQSASDVVKSSRGEGNACIIGHATVTGCEDVELRAMLSAVCIEGKKPQEVAVELMEQGVDIGAEAIRRRIERWINQNAR